MEIKEIYNTMTYGPAPESTDEAIQFLESHKRKFKLFINGAWVAPSSKEYFDSINPSNKEKLAKISEANETDVNKAVAAAKKALPEWVKIGSHQRARYLYALARQIQKHSRLFAVLESMDNGKPIRETRDIDIPIVARHFYHHAGWAQLKDSELSDYKELGVIGQIIPWNFPLMMLAWKIAPAIAMGNTVVLKPAESTSLTALLFAEICEQIGLPNGVVNIITGHGKTGADIVNHKDVNKIAFTGSTEVGKLIRRATAGTGKKLSLELGGKSPFIVFDDADLDSVVEGIVDAIWFNQGQVCCAGSRLLVQESVAEKLYKKIRARMETLRIGNPLDKSIDIGAIVDKAQLNTITKMVKLGIDEGNTLNQPSWSCPKEGYYFPPTMFTDVSPSATIAQEEIFGPVLVAMTFRSHKEAVKLANNTRYGLACSIWTENINLALDIAPQIKAGVAWINCTNVFDAAAGFGGYRESGFGREGGKEGLMEYLKPKIEESFSDQPISQSKQKLKRVQNSEPNIGIDRTTKMYIGGKQSRPDGGYSEVVNGVDGSYIGEVSKGNRKDIRNAVEAAHSCSKWTNMTGHSRAQVLYYLAENLAIRRDEFASRIVQMTNQSKADGLKEVDLSIERIYTYAALADKYDGHVHHTIHRNVTLAMPESFGVMGIICPDDFPLLGFISTVIPAIAMGNNVVVVPSEKSPFSATDFYQILETSDVPGSAVNIVTGHKDELAQVLAKHDDVDAIWYFGSKEGCKDMELLSADNMKRTWVNYGKYRNWLDKAQGEGGEFLKNASQIKNIWIPYGA
ncbi:aldehyde dehydrogenase family protein [Psychroserpens ponticola]|uniref:Aldehyde dehydrogenase family protein n=1 Tax=Psychroserpens ponticola TaxID=2932268 RepID=A0ABY7RUY3_9FLAO|nr:aldehyde dehydrogenase family protein [Psychroserpens ponticola]WCO00485.1 aldehyde dehydrogenase family protein [Psychroserpens ponticola]